MHTYFVDVFTPQGHTIKNPKTIVASELRKLPSRQRYLISGTPVQNNLQELWALFDYVHPGLLGDRYTFRRDFEKVSFRINRLWNEKREGGREGQPETEANHD